MDDSTENTDVSTNNMDDPANNIDVSTHDVDASANKLHDSTDDVDDSANDKDALTTNRHISAEMEQRARKVMRKWARLRKKIEENENVVVTTPALKYQDDYVKAFEGAVQPEADFISGLPTETIHNIFSHLILDHDPERGVKLATPDLKNKPIPHVLISLAAMSRRFHGLVENFSLSHLTRFDHGRAFRTNAQRVEDETQRAEKNLKANIIPRRSVRLANKLHDTTREPVRVYRMELVKYLRTHCIECNTWCDRRASMANGVGCCKGQCEFKAFPDQIVR